MLVFVYGSLKIGFHNAPVMNTAGGRYIEPATTLQNQFDLISLGSFPGLINGGYRVSGELFDVKNIAVLDRLEGHPSFYMRTEIPIVSDMFPGGQTASTYLLNERYHRKNNNDGVQLEDGIKTWIGSLTQNFL